MLKALDDDVLLAVTGLLAGWNAARLLKGESPVELPRTTMLGALCHYVTHADLKDFQPMKASFGLLPPLEGQPYHDRRQRRAARRAGRARHRCPRRH